MAPLEIKVLELLKIGGLVHNTIVIVCWNFGTCTYVPMYFYKILKYPKITLCVQKSIDIFRTTYILYTYTYIYT